MTRGDAAGFRVLCLGFLGCTAAPVESEGKVVYRDDGDFQAALHFRGYGTR